MNYIQNFFWWWCGALIKTTGLDVAQPYNFKTSVAESYSISFMK